MAYFAPYIDSAGLHIPAYQDIINDLVAQAQTIYGQDLYLGEDSQDYQYMSIVAAKIYDAMQLLQAVYNAYGPSGAVGTGLDSLVKLNGMKRLPATYSTAPGTLTGTPGTQITNGIVQDQNGYQWPLPSPVTIGTGGTVNVTVTCTTPGPIAAAAGTINQIVTPVYGWSSFTNTAAASLGTNVETDSALRARQAISTAGASRTLLEGTEGALAALPGVTRSVVFENDQGATAGTSTSAANPSTNISAGPANSLQIAVDADAFSRTFHTITLSSLSSLTTGAAIASALQTAIQALGGSYAAVTVQYTGGVYVITSGTTGTGSMVRVAPAATNDVSAALGLGYVNGGTEVNGWPAHSITCVVDGTATPLSIATAIWQNKGPGCLANGTTVENITDSYGLVTPIGFYVPTYLPIYVTVTVRPLPGYTSATATAIQNAVVAFLNAMSLSSPAVVISSLWGAALQALSLTKPTFSILSVTAGLSSTAQGTQDIPLNFFEAAQGVAANVTVTAT